MLKSRQPRKIKKLDSNWFLSRNTPRTIRFKRRWLRFFIAKV